MIINHTPKKITGRKSGCRVINKGDRSWDQMFYVDL